MDLTLTLEIQLRNGQLDENCENYKEMKARYSHIWGSIKGIIKKLELLMEKYKVKVAYIDGKKIAEISDDLFKVKDHDLINCFMNSEIMNEVINAQKSSTALRGKLWAVNKIHTSF